MRYVVVTETGGKVDCRTYGEAVKVAEALKGVMRVELMIRLYHKERATLVPAGLVLAVAQEVANEARLAG